MKSTIVFLKISMIVKQVMDKRTVQELQAIRSHFAEAYSDAQLCALVLVGMVIRVFGLVPAQPDGSRSIWSVVGLLVKFLRSMGDPEMMRAAPNPLDGIVEEGIDELDHINAL